MNRIETILQERGINKADFARMLGTSRQNVNSLLKNPTQSKLEEIAAALDVPVWQLFASPSEASGRDPGSASVTCPHCGKPLAVTVNVTVE